MRSASILLVTLGPCLVLGGGPSASRARGETPAPKSGEELLDLVEKTLRDLPGASFDLDAVLVSANQGVENKMSSTFTVRVDPPRRWSVEMTSGSFGGATISDGKELTTYLTLNKTYTVLPLPEDWSPTKPKEAGETIELQIAELAKPLMGHGLKEAVLKWVAASEVRTDEIDGKPCWVGVYKQPSWTYELWVSQGERPLVQRVVSRGEPSASGDKTEQTAKITTTITINVKNWNTAPQFAVADFGFTPPAGAEKSDSLVAGLGGSQEAAHPLVGLPAPDFQAEALDGSHFKLADELKKHVVMLDFWATWCGPCVEALPQVAAAAAETADKGVIFYAVNLQETPEKVREFLDENKLDAPVLMDKDGEVAKLYQVSGIPHTVLIGKDGRVQVVHVGSGGDVKGTLVKQLTALVEGKDLAAEIVEKRAKQEQAAAEQAKISLEPHGLKQVWTKKGPYAGVAVDAKSGDLYAVKIGGPIVRLDAAGEELGEIPLKSGGQGLRLANLDADPAPEILTFTAWLGDLTALDDDGTKLWTYSGGEGIDDVWGADLDGDGVDEIILGYNGGTGLHVVDSHGQDRWKTTSIGNVWHVTAGRLTVVDAMQVVSTAADGKVHVFAAADGKVVKDIQVSVYANGVRMVPSSDGEQSKALVTGTGDGDEVMLMMDGDGKTAWETPLPCLNAQHVDSLAVDAAGNYAVAGMRGGLVHVVDLASGKIVAGIGRQGFSPDMAILTRKGEKPLAVVATGEALNAFEVDAK